MSSIENRCEVGDLTAYSLLRTLVLNYFGAKFCMWHVQSCVCVCVCVCACVRARTHVCVRACCACVCILVGQPSQPPARQ